MAVRALRPWITRFHRWTGLALVVFLVVVGFTGALLPFEENLQNWLAPPPAHAKISAPSAGAKPLDWLLLGQIAERLTGGMLVEVPLERAPDEPASFSVVARPGGPKPTADTIALNPYTGREVALRPIEPLTSFSAKIMPFVFELHVRLAAGEWGGWLLGIAALAWSIDCFVGFYLTMPMTPVRWWHHWRQAWLMRLPLRSTFRFNFDLHRMVGLWLWPMLFVFAWSSVGMNLPTIYAPVMGFIFQYPTNSIPEQPPRHGHFLGWPELLTAARANVAAEGLRRGFRIERERIFWIDRVNGNYTYCVRTSRDLTTKNANSYFGIDARNGRITSVDVPSGEYTGATVSTWFGMLHTAAVGGLPYRIFVTFIGIAIVALNITGILIWLRKRSARRLRQRRGRVKKDNVQVDLLGSGPIDLGGATDSGSVRRLG